MSKIKLLEDYAAKWEVLSPTLDGVLSAQCSHCGHIHVYDMESALGQDGYWHFHRNCPNCHAPMTDLKIPDSFYGY